MSFIILATKSKIIILLLILSQSILLCQNNQTNQNLVFQKIIDEIGSGKIESFGEIDGSFLNPQKTLISNCISSF